MYIFYVRISFYDKVLYSIHFTTKFIFIAQTTA